MQLRHELKRLGAGAAYALRRFWRVENLTAQPGNSLSSPRKLAPIEEVVSRAGRETYAPD